MSDLPHTGGAGVPDRPRYGRQPFPPYTYVPGHAPHPVSDPRGHMHGHIAASVPPLNPTAWQASPAYLEAVDLFNHGYYWEAHETWESLWHAAGRGGATGIWLKALIKLAAAAVKAREGNPVGVERHARRSRELIGELRSLLQDSPISYCGMQLGRLEQAVQELIDRAAKFNSPQPMVLLPWSLTLADS
jgi:predicted metal-dependent hydrolase